MIVLAPTLHRWVAQKIGIVTAKSAQILRSKTGHHRQNGNNDE
jgi:hypothetical protein